MSNAIEIHIASFKRGDMKGVAAHHQHNVTVKHGMMVYNETFNSDDPMSPQAIVSHLAVLLRMDTATPMGALFTKPLS